MHVKYFIEFLGTFVILSIILSFFLFFNISKNKYHFNPLVTIVMLFNNNIEKIDALLYILIQLFAVYCAYLFVNKINYKYIKL